MTDPQIIGRLAIFSDGPELVMTREQFAEHVAAARAEGTREGLEQALRAVSTLPAYSPELERAHKAIRAILSAIGGQK